MADKRQLATELSADAHLFGCWWCESCLVTRLVVADAGWLLVPSNDSEACCLQNGFSVACDALW